MVALTIDRVDPPQLTVPKIQTCRTCRGPVRPGFAQCYQCDLAARTAPGLLADVVAPIAYAVKGGDLARDLRWYKSARGDAMDPRERLAGMLADFLRERGDDVWRAAGMVAPPGALAVVPSGQGRPGDHPLLQVVKAAVARDSVARETRSGEPAAGEATAGTPLPVIPLSVRPGGAGRGRFVSAGWLRVGVQESRSRDQSAGHVPRPTFSQAPRPTSSPASGEVPRSAELAGLDILLVDDTWVSGASAQSAAATLKRAGAARVAIVVLGRHVDPADPRTADFARAISGSSALNSLFISLRNCIHLIVR